MPPPRNQTRFELELVFEAAPIVKRLGGRLPSAAELVALTRTRGTELATAVLYKSILLSPLHGGFVRAMARPSTANANGLEAVIVSGSGVPSANKRTKWTDGARECARRAGYSTDVVETSRSSSVAGNARAIADLVQAKPRDAKLVFVTFGQGAAELRFFLQKRGPAHPDMGKVRGWANVAGGFGGIAANDPAMAGGIAGWAARAACALGGRSFAAMAESSSRFGLWQEPFVPPRGALIASLVPIALPRHLPPWLRARHRALASRGPNDGAILALDAIARPGLVYPAWGLSQASDLSAWAPHLEKALRVMATSLTAPVVAPEAAIEDLSVRRNETDPVLRRRRRLADRIEEQARTSQRAVDAKARRRGEARFDLRAWEMAQMLGQDQVRQVETPLSPPHDTGADANESDHFQFL